MVVIRRCSGGGGGGCGGGGRRRRVTVGGGRVERAVRRRGHHGRQRRRQFAVSGDRGRVMMVEQVSRQVAAVVRGERGGRRGRHRSGGGPGRVRPDVLQQLVGSPETLATKRRHGGRFGGCGQR